MKGTKRNSRSKMSGCYTLGLETSEDAEADSKVIDLSLERNERILVVKGCHPLREFPLTV